MISWAAATGDTATWVGAVGTWFVGLVAGLIAWLQYRHNKFWPDVVAYRDGAGRIAVRIINKGAGVGSVEDVNLLRTRRSPAEEPVISYRWEIDGQPAAKVGSSPFPVMGASTAQVVLLPLENQAHEVTDDAHVRVRYGTGRWSKPTKLTKMDGYLYGSTSIPAMPLPAAQPPAPYRMQVSIERTPRRPTTVRRPSAPTAEPEPPRR
jgi:hypothetical protein